MMNDIVELCPLTTLDDDSVVSWLRDLAMKELLNNQWRQKWYGGAIHIC